MSSIVLSGDVGRAGGRLDRRASAGEPVQNADHAADGVPGLVQRLDRGQGRAAGRDDVLDDHAAVLGGQGRALDAALQPVRLGVLADEERLRLRSSGERRARDGVGSHRHPADRRARPCGDPLGDQHGERGEPRGQQDRPLCVHVVLRGRAARERHAADDQRVLAQLLAERPSRLRDLTSNIRPSRPPRTLT